MRQAIAFWLILLLAAMADGIAAAFGIGALLPTGGVVLPAAGALVRWGWADEVHAD